MSWFLLVLSGLLECAWAIGLKFSEGFTRFWPSVITLLIMGASFSLLAVATKELPIGTSYAVWVGIGAVGTAIIGIAFLDEPVNPGRIASLLGLTISLIGLKLSS
ncbi:MAG: SMR family transporter [Vulcanimicrobiota bacterium]